MARIQHPARALRAPLVALALTTLTTLTACSAGSPSAATATTPAATATTGTAVPPPATAPTSPGDPTRVAIPSLGVDSSLLRLGLNADETVQVPPSEQGMTAGWYVNSAVPGERGASVVIGHNNTRYGKAVFHDLGKIKKGADIAIRGADGKITHFTVTTTQTVSKKSFPTQQVYAPTPAPTLRLITCDGSIDAQGHPVDNLIVYATLTT
ncbi:class F sortase [Streptomyces sp. SPB162]|uniref:class F sortase n=1 Tax=Streptomyces sp. SPB162 TaxID=2940560 RepID=UPI002404F3CA|nr:class F sortase [Streptomyces sp. SPB162]MDF9813952.1 LPXTG-site transpeptidase (sortase) family protein [Streptomyces sp. SPB162]